MKTRNIRTILIIAFLTIFTTACTDLYSDEDNLIEDTIENTKATGGKDEKTCDGKDC
jgi:hypothetical protein